MLIVAVVVNQRERVGRERAPGRGVAKKQLVPCRVVTFDVLVEKASRDIATHT